MLDVTVLSETIPFYQEIIRQALWAKQSGRLKAILWHQGESDTVTPELADLGMPDLPFIIGDLAEFYGTHKEHAAPNRVKRIHQVREALKNMPNRLT